MGFLEKYFYIMDLFFFPDHTSALFMKERFIGVILD